MAGNVEIEIVELIGRVAILNALIDWYNGTHRNFPSQGDERRRLGRWAREAGAQLADDENTSGDFAAVLARGTELTAACAEEWDFVAGEVLFAIPEFKPHLPRLFEVLKEEFQDRDP